MIAMRRLKKLTRYLLGTSEVYQKLCLDAHAETLKCLSKAIGLTTKKLVKAAVEEQFSFTDAQCSHGHTEDEFFFFERRDRVVRHSLRSNRVFGNNAIFPRKAVQNSTASSDNCSERICGVQTKKARSNETHRAEDAHSAEMAEHGTTSYSQSGYASCGSNVGLRFFFC